MAQRLLPVVCRRSFTRLTLRRRSPVIRLERVSYLHSSVVRLSVAEQDVIPSPNEEGKTVSPKIEQIVQAISGLTLLETSQLNELLKTTLRIPDAPIMTMGAMPMTAGPTAEGSSDTKQEEQTEFTVKLVKFAEDSKIKLIKEIKTLMEGMNLVQSKKFVEGVPQIIKSEVSKEEAERLKTALETAGGVVEIE